jgi:hypothetical protein
MTDYLGASQSHQSSSVQWKATSIGDEHASYRYIQQDPYLHDKITPVDGYSRTLDGYKYTVKIYDNGNVSVFRKKIHKGYQSNTDTHIRTDNGEYEVTKNFVGNGYDRITSPQQRSNLSKENTRILEFKIVNLEEFHPEEEWEIFNQHPIVIIENKVILILARRESSV